MAHKKIRWNQSKKKNKKDKDHRISLAGRDPQGSSNPNPGPAQNHPQEPIQMFLSSPKEDREEIKEKRLFGKMEGKGNKSQKDVKTQGTPQDLVTLERSAIS